MSEKVFLNDKIAKKLFKNEKYGKMLSARVISDYLDADYEEVYNNIKLSSEEIAFSSLTVNSTSDVIYQDNYFYFNIEINYNNTPSKKAQLEAYTYQLYLKQLHNYKDYNNLKKIVQISIDAFDFFGKNEFMYKVKLMEEKYKISYNDIIQIVHLNLDYLHQIDYNVVKKGDNKLMKDLYFLICNNDEKLELVYKKDELMKDIIDESKRVAGIEAIDLFLTDEEMIANDQKFFRKEGYKDATTQIAKKLLSIGMNFNDITKITGLTEKEITKLTKEDLVKTDLFLTDEEMIANDQKFFRNEGYKEGAKDKSIQIAKNMLKENISLDQISRLTGLSKEELNKISVN